MCFPWLLPLNVWRIEYLELTEKMKTVDPESWCLEWVMGIISSTAFHHFQVRLTSLNAIATTKHFTFTTEMSLYSVREDWWTSSLPNHHSDRTYKFMSVIIGSNPILKKCWTKTNVGSTDLQPKYSTWNIMKPENECSEAERTKFVIFHHPLNFTYLSHFKHESYLCFRILSSWWFQPISNILAKFGSFPQIGMKIKIYLKTTT